MALAITYFQIPLSMGFKSHLELSVYNQNQGFLGWTTMLLHIEANLLSCAIST